MWQEATLWCIFKDVSICHDAKVYNGAGEMVKWLGALAALPREPGFYSENLHDSSQPSVIPVQGIQFFSSGLWAPEAYSAQR